MARKDPRILRLELAAHYEKDAAQADKMAKMAETENTKGNLKNLAARKRTYAATARRMARRKNGEAS